MYFNIIFKYKKYDLIKKILISDVIHDIILEVA